ncbi:MAG: septation protein SepH [Marmoricola sp.]
MQHLTPVGLSQDGKELVLTSDTGEEFAVAVDHRLRAAMRGDHARLGQLEMKMESALRPRDIQARIRGGESAEDVAAAAQTTVESIMPFAAPVIAERAHVAQTAVKASIRRASADSNPAGRTLDEASRVHLSNVSVRADDVEWDAWRREDGRWTLVATYVASGTEHRAEFTYDQPGRYVVADDLEARLLTGESSPAAAPEEPARRLASVPSGDELPLGDDALELVRERPAEHHEPEHQEPEPHDAVEHTSDLSEVARASTEGAPATEQAAFDDLAADHADADWIAPFPDEPEAGSKQHTQAPSSPGDDVPVADHEPERPVPDEPDEPAAEQAPKKKGRSSVPSWDEIMFGGGKND